MARFLRSDPCNLIHWVDAEMAINQIGSMGMNGTKTFLVIAGAIWLAFSVGVFPALGPDEEPAALAPLPALSQRPDPNQVALGRLLFFDGRISGDATISCSNCHDLSQGGTDGLALSKGYPGSLYFRNTPTVINAVHGKYFYWEGRLPASDVPTMVRDHISEAHFMQADGRLAIERLRQVPEYENGFKRAFGGEPSYGRILNAITAFLRTLRSTDVPFDRYLRGNRTAISEQARQGLELFQGKAGCIRCHSGAMLSDGSFHNLGLAANQEIFQTPERHITFRRFFKTLGVAEYTDLRQDVGLYAVTKRDEDRGRFRTPTLREVSQTAPYMHNGSLKTLEEVVDFYDRGGGTAAGKDPLLQPLSLTQGEKAALVEFLNTLSGRPISVGEVSIPEYKLRSLGDNY